MPLRPTLQLRLPNHPRPNEESELRRRPSFAASTAEGWRYILGHPTIRTTMLVAMMAQFLGMSFMSLLPVFAKDVLGVGPAGQGLLLTGQGLGALCSAFLIASAGDSVPKGKLMISGVALYGLLEVAFSGSRWFALSFVLMVFLGVCHIAANALVQTIVQGHTAAALRGRVLATLQQNQVLMSSGALLAGASAAAWGAPLTVAVMGLTCAAGAVAIALRFPLVRAIR